MMRIYSKTTSPVRFIRNSIIVAVMAVMPFALVATTSDAASSGKVTDTAKLQRSDPTVVITRGKAETVELGHNVSDIMVADPSVLDVTVLQSNRLYIVGRAIGNTNLIALDDQGNIVERMNVHVAIDDQTLQDALSDLFPREDIVVKTLSDQIVLTGSVSSAMIANRVGDLALRFVEGDGDLGIVNLLDVAGEQQVTLRVKIVEVSRTILKEFGIETNFNDPVEPSSADPLFDLVQPENLNESNGGLSSQLLGNGSTASTPIALGRLIADPAIRGVGAIEVLFRALEEENMIHTLAEPNLTSLSGEEASFLAGGEFPVPSGLSESGTAVFSYRPFGVTLNFRPTVLSNERIALQLDTEVSSRDTTQDAEIGGVELPAFDVSRATTTVELGSGDSLMIAGLLNSETIDGLSGVPGVKDTPVLGDLIKSQSFQRNESEVLVIITAYLVKPYKDNSSFTQDAPENENDSLTQAFAAIIRNTYGDRADEALNIEESYGYLLD